VRWLEDVSEHSPELSSCSALGFRCGEPHPLAHHVWGPTGDASPERQHRVVATGRTRPAASPASAFVAKRNPGSKVSCGKGERDRAG
jgi:hypothetical protein